jgi:uncharacterized protein
MNQKKETIDWREKFASFLGVATIFLMIGAAVMTVEFFNRLKENQYIGQSDLRTSEIIVSGRAEKYVAPDLALISVGVKSEALTVAEAMSENTEKMNSIIGALEDDFRLEGKDLKTTLFNLRPLYEWRESKLYSSRQRVLVGYEVDQSLEVKIRDFDLIGDIIEQVTFLGANQVSELRFIIENEDSIKDELRAIAVAEAKEKADNLANQLKVRLVRIISFREETPATPWLRGAGEMFYADSSELSPAPSIQSGENKVEISVSITYEIN